jgi:hypothetical protein
LIYVLRGLTYLKGLTVLSLTCQKRKSLQFQAVADPDLAAVAVVKTVVAVVRIVAMQGAALAIAVPKSIIYIG